MSTPPVLLLLQGDGREFKLYAEKRVALGWVGDLACMAALYVCAPAAKLWLLLLHMLLQSCARMVEPLGSTAISLMLGMLFSCPRMVEPLGWRRNSMGIVWYVVRYGVWCGTVCDIVCWYGMMVRFGGGYTT